MTQTDYIFLHKTIENFEFVAISAYEALEKNKIFFILSNKQSVENNQRWTICPSS
jgi:hypothetical protein